MLAGLAPASLRRASLPARRADEARGPGPRRRARASRSRAAPRARTSASSRARASARSSAATAGSASGRARSSTPSGAVVGAHSGHHEFTVGQRRGLGRRRARAAVRARRPTPPRTGSRSARARRWRPASVRIRGRPPAPARRPGRRGQAPLPLAQAGVLARGSGRGRRGRGACSRLPSPPTAQRPASSPACSRATWWSGTARSLRIGLQQPGKGAARGRAASVGLPEQKGNKMNTETLITRGGPLAVLGGDSRVSPLRRPPVRLPRRRAARPPRTSRRSSTTPARWRAKTRSKFRTALLDAFANLQPEQRQDPRRHRVRDDAERPVRAGHDSGDHPGDAGLVPAGRCRQRRNRLPGGVRRGHRRRTARPTRGSSSRTARRTAYPTTRTSQPEIKTYVVGIGDFAATPEGSSMLLQSQPRRAVRCRSWSGLVAGAAGRRCDLGGDQLQDPAADVHQDVHQAGRAGDLRVQARGQHG